MIFQSDTGDEAGRRLCSRDNEYVGSYRTERRQAVITLVHEGKSSSEPY